MLEGQLEIVQLLFSIVCPYLVLLECLRLFSGGRELAQSSDVVDGQGIWEAREKKRNPGYGRREHQPPDCPASSGNPITTVLSTDHHQPIQQMTTYLSQTVVGRQNHHLDVELLGAEVKPAQENAKILGALPIQKCFELLNQHKEMWSWVIQHTKKAGIS